jgi:hypothetical protein
MGVKTGQCPALEWNPENPDESRCGLITNKEKYLSQHAVAFIEKEIPNFPEFMGAGKGCCISARVLGPHGMQDFASLSPLQKIDYTRIIRTNPNKLQSRQ